MTVRARRIGWATAGLLTGAQMAWGAYSGVGTFTKITSRADLTDGYYVVASSNGLAAMTHTNAGTYFTNCAISPAANVLTDPSPAIVWLIQTNAAHGGHTLFNEASNRYVSFSGGANAAQAAGAVNGATGVWTFTYASASFGVGNGAASARILQYNPGSPRFACYTSAQQRLALYKMEPVLEAPVFTSGSSLGATVGVARTFTVAATGTPTPVLALHAQTASSGFDFAPETGQLSYLPPPADGDSARTFTFTAGNSVGMATQVVSVWVAASVEAAPAFGANPGPLVATAGVERVFYVSASGYPAPVLSLQGQTASGGHAFAPETGRLSYVPPEADVGTQTFAFAASNGLGVARQTVTVSVAAAPSLVPTVAVTNIGTNSFEIRWTEVAAAADYQVQVATDTNFTASVGGELATLAATANSGLSDGWSYVNGASNAISYHRLVATTAPGVVSEAFSTTGRAEVVVGYSVATYGGAGANVLRISYSLDGGTSWTPFATNANATSSTYVTEQRNALPPAALGQADVRIKWHCDGATASAGLRLQALTISGTQGGVDGSLLVDETVAALTYGATGLEMETTYRVRVRATDGLWSEIASATTAGADPTPPWFTGGAGPHSTTAGVAVAFLVSALGTPTPALALRSGSASAGSYGFVPDTGYFLYLPPTNDAGAQTFTFTASNSQGVATQVVGVSVGAATPPAFAALGAQQATTGVSMAFTVMAEGAPAPALALQGTTASSGYSFMPDTGYLLYTPPTNDVGERTFTFTASNLAGMATQTVGVGVALAPPAAPEILPIPKQYVLIGHALSYAVAATDADTPASGLSFSCASAVDASTWDFDAVTGDFLFEPTAAQFGTNLFVFEATDDTDLSSGPVSMVVVVSSAADQVAVSFGKTRIVGEEGVATARIPVNLAFTGSAEMEFRFIGPTNGAAQRGVDFNCATTLVVSGAASGELVLSVVDDALAEGPESVTVQVVPVSPAMAGAATQAVLYIRDNDAFSIVAGNITGGSNKQQYESPGERILEALCPDVALLQEFNVTNASHRSWVDQHFGTNFSYYVEGGADIPNGIVSRWPIVFSGEWDDVKVSNRDFAWATIDLPGTQDLHVVSVHLLTTSASIRNEEAEALSALIAGAGWRTNGYVAIGGDFNIASRTESAISALSGVVTDAKQPADQDNESDSKNTNSGRNKPYDLVLPSANLNARHRAFSFHGHSFANGMVFDSRPAYVAWAHGLPPPALATDSAALNMQHMAVMKVFDLEPEAVRVDPPQAFAADAAGPSQIQCSFAVNASGNDVLVVWNHTGDFDAPEGASPGAGQSFAGGTVLYQGTVSPQSHTGLASCASCYYKCWSVAGTNYSSSGREAGASTTGPAAPVSVRASATNSADFMAAWSAVPGASSYRLDVGTGPGFSGDGGAWSTIFRETMGASSGTTEIAAHEAAGGFDNDAFAMTQGGADAPADIRTTSASSGYLDPAGHAASGNANVYFKTTGVGVAVGFAIEGIDTRGYDGLSLSFGYRKESNSFNMPLGVEWSTNGGAGWSEVPVATLPATNAAVGWYMVSNLAVSAAALESTNLSLRWSKAGAIPGRVDDILLQGHSGGEAAFVPTYSNRTVVGTSASVTGLTAGATYYFRVAAIASCTGAFSAVANATTLENMVAPSFGPNPGPFATTAGVAVAFTVTISGGHPTPALALAGTTASSGYAFDPSTGQLSYAPTLDDIGERTFTFTASNAAGVATQAVAVSVGDLPAEAPAFTSGAAHGATTSVAMAFTVAAAGHPAPVLALAGATASGGYGFAPETGQLSYAPPEADLGAQTFTFTASNAAGVATQIATVAVSEGIPAPPASVWAGATNIIGFTAAWASAPLAAEYRLDVSPFATFRSIGGPSRQTVLASNAATSSAHLEDGWSGTDLGGTNFVVMTQATSVVLSPAFSTEGCTNLTVDFRTRTYGGTMKSNITVSISPDNGTNWTAIGVVCPPSGSAWGMAPTLVHAADLGGSQTRIRWQSLDASTNVGVGVSNLIVTGWGMVPEPSYLPGYSNAVVAGTSQGVTGLTAETTYYFRLRSVNANGAGANSAVAAVDTLPKADQSISFPAIGDQVTTNVATLSATASSGLAVGFAVASGPALQAGSALTFTNAGEVRVVASQAGNGEWNAASEATNVFAVAKAAAGVTLGGLEQAYDGTARMATATTAPPGLAMEFTYDGSSAAPIHAGAYAVVGAVRDAMYGGTAGGTLTVAKAPLTVAADAKRKPFGAPNPLLTFRYGEFVAGEDASALSAEPTADTAVDAATPVGVHAGAIAVSGGAAEDYAFNYVAADFTVTEAIDPVEAGGDDLGLALGPLADGEVCELWFRTNLTSGSWGRVDAKTNLEAGAHVTLTHVGGGTNLLGYYRFKGPTVLSEQVVGQVQLARPAKTKLGLLGIPFRTQGQTLSSLLDPQAFSGHRFNTGKADQLILWDVEQQTFLNLVLRVSGTDKAWKLFDRFEEEGYGYTNPVLPSGSALWFRSSTTDVRKVTIAGEVVMDAAVTNAIRPGLQLLSNPFSDEVRLGDLSIHVNATAHRFNVSMADQIVLWDAGTQSFLTLVLNVSAGVKAWKLYDGFEVAGVGYTNPVIHPGQGFWFRAKNAFDWVETNKYKDHLE